MRLPYALLIAGLLLLPVAAAAGPNSHAPDKAREAVDSHGDPDAASDHATGHGAPTWVASLRTLLSSWHENASAIRERCHAAEKTDNATQEQQTSWAHCIRDGYKGFLEAFRADLKQARLARSS
jgi:hypothetical protein